jgi:hypothetical protein
MCCVFVLFFFVLCDLCCQFLWIFHIELPLRYSLTFIYNTSTLSSSWPCQEVTLTYLAESNLGNTSTWKVFLKIIKFTGQWTMYYKVVLK